MVAYLNGATSTIVRAWLYGGTAAVQTSVQTAIGNALSPAAHPNAHVMVIMMENHDYSEIIGNSAAAYVNQVAGQYTSLTQNYGMTHPSLPNYLELLSGSTQGVSD